MVSSRAAAVPAAAGAGTDPTGGCCAPVTDTVLDEETAQVLAVRLKALADPVRIRLVSLLACTPGGELCACDLPALLGRTQPTISHHLKLLTDAGFVTREQRGKWAWFTLVPDALDQLRNALGQTS
ncbi:MAG: metalloregulator ArsR/SmtB family transcription factor [Acidimicrobiales bacterium]